MGYNKNKALDKRNGKTERQPTLTERWNYQNSKEKHDAADWARCDGEAVIYLIAEVSKRGGAVLFGYSRDKGAYRLIVMDDGGKATEWIPCTTDITEAVWAFSSRLLGDDDPPGTAPE